MRSDTQLWTRHEMDMGEGMPEEVFHMPATPEEIKEAMPDAMHWKPMTPDAVFEDGEAYLLWDGNDGTVELGTWLQYQYGFDVKDGHYIEDRKYYTHYARITEPK